MTNDNESWIIDAGDTIIQKRVTHGIAALQSIDQIIYCLWVADYGMRNAGDLATAADLYAPFQDEAERLSKELNLPLTLSAFRLKRTELEQRYFELFDGICNEIRAARSMMTFGD